MLHKIRKNTDASHITEHFLEISIVNFSKTEHCQIRTNLRNKDGMVALSIPLSAYLTIDREKSTRT